VKRYINILVALMASKNPIGYVIIIRKALSVILAPLDIVLAFIERLCAPSQKLHTPRLVFIIGGHRTGATFISQVIANHNNLRSLNNFNSLFSKSNFLLFTLISNFSSTKPLANIKNFYGQSWGLLEISDVHEVWDKWYGIDHDTAPKNLSEDIKQDLKLYFSGLSQAYGKPIIIKNGRNSLMVRQLAAVFPEALFVLVERSIEDVALSTLSANKVFGRKEDVWGLRPKKIQNLDGNLTEVEKVVKNLIALNSEITEQLEAVSKKNIFKINYSEFCIEPEKKLENLYDWISKRFGVTLNVDIEIPKSLEIRKNDNQKQRKEIRKAISRF
jgi:hypothetical protein